jgi:hypothetical protein
MPAYALTIFTGAFLLFQVQPLIGKYILPWFGGGPGVWTTCMLFFQVLLLGGYAYAHFSSRWLKARSQAALHLGLLAAALVVLPIIPGNSWKPHGGGNPTLQILALLTVTLGLPYFVLSSTGPLLQHWFSRTNPGRSPYRLYALSNIGSLLALVTYPVYFETHFTRKAQAGLWGWGLVLYVLGCGFCALRVWKAGQPEKPSSAGEERETARTSTDSVLAPLSSLHCILWLLLPACASVLLLATTNKMCQDVAVIPFLWVLPLALYLLSFIICFDSPRWYKRFPYTLGLIAACIGICWALFEGTDLSLYKQVGIYSGGLFICCMICHGELYRLRPDPRHLTLFYLMIAAGGALGGIFVVAAAPFLFTDYYELQWGLLFCGLLFVLVCLVERSDPQPNSLTPALTSSSWPWLAATLPLIAFGGLDWLLARLGREHPAIPRGYFVGLRIGLWVLLALAAAWWLVRKQYRHFRHWRLVTCAWLVLGWLGLAVALWSQVSGATTEAVYRSRNFYGVLTVFEHSKNEPQEHHFLLQHGRITHGLQFVDHEKAAWPTSYYAEQSGIGLAVNALPAGPRRIGVVGLGTATFTAYGRPGDYWRIYEINRDVKKVATSWFSYLNKCAGRTEVVLGDARLSMEQEPPQQFDLLALDAFSSDAIPVHLLTKEAFELYGRHLKTNGIIVVHISNHYLDLEPVVINLARQFNYHLALIDFDETEDEWWLYASTWIIMTRDDHILKSPAISEAAGTLKTTAGKVPLWTDDFASLFQILK